MDADKFNRMLREAKVDIGELKKKTSKEQLQIIKSDAPELYYKIIEELKAEGKLGLTIEEQVDQFVHEVKPDSTQNQDIEEFISNVL